MRGRAALRQTEGQRVAVHIVPGELAGDRGVFVAGGRAVRRRRRIIHGRDVDRDGAGGRAAVPVADRIGEAVGAVEVRRRNVIERAVGIEGDGAVGRRAVQCKRQRIAIDVVTRHATGDRTVFLARDRRRRSGRRIVDRVHADGDRAERRAALAVAHLIRERVRAVEVGGGRVGVAAVRVDRDGAVRRTAIGGKTEGQRVAVRIVPGELAGDRGVFAAGGRAARSRRRVVDRRDVDRDRSGRGPALAVGDGVGESVGTVVVGVRHVIERAVGIVRDSAVRGRAVRRQTEGQRIAIHIRRLDAAADRTVFLRAIGRVRRGRRVVDWRHIHRDRAGCDTAIAVGHAIGERIRAVEIRVRHIGVRTVGIDRHHAVRRITVGRQGEGQRVAVHIGRRQAAGDVAVFRAGRRTARREGRIVHRRHIQRDGRGVRAALPVGDGVGEAVGAVVIGGRRVGVAAVRIDRDRAVRRAAVLRQRESQRVAIRIGRRQLAGDRVIFRAATRAVRGVGCRVVAEIARRHDDAVEEFEKLDIHQRIGAVGRTGARVGDDELAQRIAREYVVGDVARIDRRIRASAAVDAVVARPADDAVIAAHLRRVGDRGRGRDRADQEVGAVVRDRALRGGARRRDVRPRPHHQRVEHRGARRIDREAEIARRAGRDDAPFGDDVAVVEDAPERLLGFVVIRAGLRAVEPREADASGGHVAGQCHRHGFGNAADRIVAGFGLHRRARRLVARSAHAVVGVTDIRRRTGTELAVRADILRGDVDARPSRLAAAAIAVGDGDRGAFVARTAEDQIVARAADQQIVAAPAVDRVVAVAAGQRVAARAAEQIVVARAAQNAVVARVAPQHVVARAAVDRHVAIGEARAGQIDDVVAVARVDDLDVADARPFRRRIAIGIVEEQRVVGRGKQDRVGARTAVEHVVAAHVAEDRHALVRARRAGVADIQRHPAARPGRIDRSHQRVVAVAAEDPVGTRAAGQRVVARTAIELVVARFAEQLIVALAAGNRIVARTAADHVVAVAAGDDVAAGRAGRIGGNNRRELERRREIVRVAEEARAEIGQAQAGRRSDEAQHRVGAVAIDHQARRRQAGSFEAQNRAAREPVDDEILPQPDRIDFALGHFYPRFRSSALPPRSFCRSPPLGTVPSQPPNCGCGPSVPTAQIPTSLHY